MMDSTKTQHYPFDTSYQLKLLALACRDPLFLTGYRDVIKPEWFDDGVLMDMARLALD